MRYVQSVEQGRENLTLTSANRVATTLSVLLRDLLTPPTTPRPPRGRPPAATATKAPAPRRRR